MKDLKDMDDLELIDAAHEAAADYYKANLALNVWNSNLETVGNCSFLQGTQRELYTTIKLLQQDTTDRLIKDSHKKLVDTVVELSKRDLIKDLK